ncbi:MAG: hypothetical protein WAU53_17310 [Rhodoplanes sp.]
MCQVFAEEDDRQLHSERDHLINERVQHVNRIQGLCAVHGIYDYEPLRPNRLARLERLRAADGCELPPRFKAEIMRELQRLELVVNMIETLEAERDAIASTGRSLTHANAKEIQDLIRCRGIYLIVHFGCDWRETGRQGERGAHPNGRPAQPAGVAQDQTS